MGSGTGPAGSPQSAQTRARCLLQVAAGIRRWTPETRPLLSDLPGELPPWAVCGVLGTRCAEAPWERCKRNSSHLRPPKALSLPVPATSLPRMCLAPRAAFLWSPVLLEWVTHGFLPLPKFLLKDFTIQSPCIHPLWLLGAWDQPQDLWMCVPWVEGGLGAVGLGWRLQPPPPPPLLCNPPSPPPPQAALPSAARLPALLFGARDSASWLQ